MFNDQIKQFEVSGISYKHLTIKEREMLILLRAKGLSIIKDQGKLSKGIIADHKLPLQNKQGSKLSLYYLVNDFQFGTLKLYKYA